jgi:hypothetical protein
VRAAADLPASWGEAMKAQAAGKLALLELITDPLDVPEGARFVVPDRYLD